MSASDFLGPMFHGTVHPFKVGEIVSPRNGNEFAWATSDRRVAKNRAEHHAEEGTLPRVFEVEPVGDVAIGNAYLGPGTYKSREGFRVIKEVTDE